MIVVELVLIINFSIIKVLEHSKHCFMHTRSSFKGGHIVQILK